MNFINPEPSREIEITRFVDPKRINYRFYDRPYSLGPDDDEENYFSLAEALEKEKKIGIARWTMRKKRYVGGLSGRSGNLELFTFRYSGEVVDIEELPSPQGRKLEPIEIRMAEQLIEAMTTDFDSSSYRDEYRQRVMELINTKLRGEIYMFEKEKKRRTKFDSLTDSLERSLRNVRKKKIA
jgi:DNA end-binding protein Ku